MAGVGLTNMYTWKIQPIDTKSVKTSCTFGCRHRKLFGVFYSSLRPLQSSRE